MDKKFKIFFIVFVILTLILLFEGFFWYYSSKLSYFCFETFSFSERCGGELTYQKYQKLFFIDKFRFDTLRTGFNPLIWDEKGIIESFQILFLFISIICFIQILVFKKRDKKNFFYLFLIIYLICLLYYFFEEISWGQHFFNWKSPDFFIEHNNQKETNLHNISNLLDQVPRALLSVWCSLSFIIIIIFKKINSNEGYHIFILPSKKLKYISFLLLIFILPDLILKLFVSNLDYTRTLKINFTDIYIFFSLNFIRLSEYHELLFTTYILNHSIFYKNYLKRKI